MIIKKTKYISSILKFIRRLLPKEDPKKVHVSNQGTSFYGNKEEALKIAIESQKEMEKFFAEVRESENKTLH